ncbi:glucokinase family protein [Xanthomonas vasicola]|uniref:ROK family protein n=1 Tax=Xanthomonas vasicola TaxID=56459 RepID=A0ABD7S6X5_XANVA|nr:glucokinase family protein [Xanthomonas vasicola]AZR22169.1 ROK family protein [Xanthomonas vasicola]KGR39425.1 glucokinase [Xanthomonas vasicola]KGR43395.1 glucokinase [Xanthomonas vasicola]KGR60633.1 glucokinase [Xanthomonas vasicola]MDO6985859.1 glucokinase family protein [Xanthomonas vasicola]
MAAISGSADASASHAVPVATSFIAADVGGTHVRLGHIVQASAAAIEMSRYRTYRCAEHASLEAILEDFMQQRRGVDAVVIASAGVALDDGSFISNNLPWTISPSRIGAALAVRNVQLVNDFEAVAYAAPQMEQRAVLQLSGPTPRHARASGPILVVGPGTGLGAAVWIDAKPRAIVLATEAGQVALASAHEQEYALLQILLRGRHYLPLEHVLSGPGLLHLYDAVCELHAAMPRHHLPAAVTHAALHEDDALARECLQLFCGLLGSAVGDMALAYGAAGGIYLAGGFLPTIGQFLAGSTFAERFLAKGNMRAVLERIPVKLVEHGQLGVLGAANWYVQHHTHVS